MNSRSLSKGEEQEFLEQAVRFQDNALGDGALERFEQAMKQSPEKRRLFMQVQAQSAAIQAQLRQCAYRVPEPELKWSWLTPLWRSFRLPTVLAGAIALVLIMASWWRPGSLSLNSHFAAKGTDHKYLATLLLAENCVWRHSALMPGGRFGPESYQLERGRAWLHFDGGAEMVMVGPAEVTLDGSGRARLNHGKVVIRAAEDASGFTLVTSAGPVVDLGTEFLVATVGNGATECHVLAGSVSWEMPGRKAAVLRQGEAQRFQDGQAKAIPVTTMRFQDFVPPIPEAKSEALLAYEPFAYQTSNAPAESLNGGQGWQSSWRGRFVPQDKAIDANPRMSLQPDQSLSFPGLVSSQGGSLLLEEAPQWRLRRLPMPVDFGSDGVYYFSFLARRARASEVPGTVPASLMLDLRCEQSYWTHWISFRINPKHGAAIVADGNSKYSYSKLPVNETLLAVCKIVTARSGPDQLFMKIYGPGETVDAMDSGTWLLTSPEFDFDLPMNLIIAAILRGPIWTMDELRFGTSWQAVVPLTPTAKLQAQKE